MFLEKIKSDKISERLRFIIEIDEKSVEVENLLKGKEFFDKYNGDYDKAAKEFVLRNLTKEELGDMSETLAFDKLLELRTLKHERAQMMSWHPDIPKLIESTNGDISAALTIQLNAEKAAERAVLVESAKRALEFEQKWDKLIKYLKYKDYKVSDDNGFYKVTDIGTRYVQVEATFTDPVRAGDGARKLEFRRDQFLDIYGEIMERELEPEKYAEKKALIQQNIAEEVSLHVKEDSKNKNQAVWNLFNKIKGNFSKQKDEEKIKNAENDFDNGFDR